MADRATSGRLKAEELLLLRQLAAAGADRTPVVLTSREVGANLGVSQQAADRYLLRLAKDGYLERSLAVRRQSVRLTARAMELLRAEHHAYRRLFEGPGRLTFTGEVASGLGEGRYYLSQPGYVVQFAERLGYSPFPGTLNLKLADDALRRVEEVAHWDGLRIDGFQASGRTFGGATCHRATMNGRPCHLIRPDRTHHTHVVEFIAPVSLRETLGIKDGDRVEIALEES